MDNNFKLPSEFQIGESVHLVFWSHAGGANVRAVQFVEAAKEIKVFYDVDVFAGDGSITRLHRVEERMIKRYLKDGEYSN